jgi:hypothetical protein
MTLPALLVGFLVSTLIAAAFHVWRGGSAGRFLLYLISSWVGFWVGHFVAARLDLTIGSFGALRLGPAIVCCLAFLLVGHWLSLAPASVVKNK